jgi:hypothetical protein
MRMRSLFVLAIFLAMGSAQAQSYLSPDPAPYSIEDRFRLEVDLFRGAYDTTIRLDRSVTVAGRTVVTPGTQVSAEDDLGLASTQNLGQLELTLLPGEHHMVRLSALSMRREGSHILTRNITWGNSSPYLVGERVDSHLNFSMAGLTYGYLPFRTDRYELGVSLGVQIASVGANAEVRSRTLRAEESAVGPIPLLGVEGRYDFTHHWSLDARLQYLSLGLVESLGVDVNKVDGTIIDWRLAIRYRQNQHLIYGLGYRNFNLDVVSPTTNPAGMVSLGLTGPILFVQGSL